MSKADIRSSRQHKTLCNYFCYGGIRDLAATVLKDLDGEADGEAASIDRSQTLRSASVEMLEDNLRLGAVIHQWPDHEWERIIAAQATL